MSKTRSAVSSTKTAAVAPITEPAPVVPANPKDAYAASLAEMEALAADDLEIYNVDSYPASVLINAHVRSIQSLKSQIAQAMPNEPVGLLDRLPVWLLALQQADSDVKNLATTTPDTTEAQERVVAARDTLVGDLRAAQNRGLVPVAALDSITGGRGKNVVGPELYRCIEVARSHWSSLQGRSAITEDELSGYERLFVQLFAAASDNSRQDARSVALDRRQRLWTLISRAYRVARKGALYLAESEEAADKLVPPLHKGNTRSRPSKDDDTTPAPAPSATTTASAPASTVPSASTSTTAPAATPLPPAAAILAAHADPTPTHPGMFGGSPFQD